MVGIQVVSARIGRVSGYGLAGNMRRHSPRPVLYTLVSLLLVANTINIGADLSAMADAAHLVVGGRGTRTCSASDCSACCCRSSSRTRGTSGCSSGSRCRSFAYVAVVFAIDLPWLEVVKGTFLPSLRMSADYLTAVVAILGTTISPISFSGRHRRSARTCTR
jgi:Mn2+/Fe2+ NRAMP family transporter